MERRSSMQRNKAVDAVKGVAILLVMLGHCIVLNGLNETDPYIYDVIKSVQMPLFMLVSGVLASYSLHKYRLDKWYGIKKLPKRVVSYLLPFTSWFVVVYVWTHAWEAAISLQSFLTEGKELLFQTDKGLWFLTTLFVIQLMVTLAQTLAVLLTAGKKVPEALVFAFGSFALYVLFFLQSRSGNTFLSPSLTVQYFPFFFLGYFGHGYLEIAEHIERIGQRRPYCVGIAGVLLTALFLWQVITQDLTKPVDGVMTLLQQMLASLLGTAVIYFTVTAWAEKKGKLQQGKQGAVSLLSFLGQYTLEIYVIHFRYARILKLSNRDLTFYSLRGIVWLLAAFACMAVLTAVTIFLIRKVKLLNLLLFGKPFEICDRQKAGADIPR